MRVRNAFAVADGKEPLDARVFEAVCAASKGLLEVAAVAPVSGGAVAVAAGPFPFVPGIGRGVAAAAAGGVVAYAVVRACDILFGPFRRRQRHRVLGAAVVNRVEQRQLMQVAVGKVPRRCGRGRDQVDRRGLCHRAADAASATHRHRHGRAGCEVVGAAERSHRTQCRLQCCSTGCVRQRRRYLSVVHEVEHPGARRARATR
eukprot:scaffold228_cov312-Pinguiococcus_pyrenoidosus.AAC.58